MKRYFGILIILLLLPLRVYALSITCPNMVSENEDFECIVEDTKYRGITAIYKFDSVFNYVNSKVLDKTICFYCSNKGFAVGNKIVNDGLKMSVKFKTNAVINEYKDYDISLINVVASDNKDASTLTNVSRTIKVVSNINTLDKLEISNGKFDSSFKKEVTNYHATVNSDSTVISAVLSDKNAKLEGDIGKKELKYGINVFTVMVTSVRGYIREYKIYITRPNATSNVKKKSSDATLKKLSVKPGKISFKSDVFYYTFSVDNSVDDILVEAVPNNNKAKVNIEKPKKLVVGDNEIKITVTSEDGNTLGYVIVVTKKEKLSNDARIVNLSIKGYEIDFKEDKFNYDLNIYNESKLDIVVELSDDKASYEIIGNMKLTNKSKINIKVTAEDGSVNNYYINIHKDVDVNSEGIFKKINIWYVVMFIAFILIIIGLKVMNSNVEK